MKRDGKASRSRGGFSLLEVLIVAALVLVALQALCASLGRSIDLNKVNEETALAVDGLRQMVELLEGVEEFGDLYAMYNDDPRDDMDLPVPAPGSGFAVPGLAPVEGDPDGMVGEILFPVTAGDFGFELREDLEDAAWGMPRDLNADGDIDEIDHATDYRILPVLVRVRWQGVSGERTLELRTLIADR